MNLIAIGISSLLALGAVGMKTDGDTVEIRSYPTRAAKKSFSPLKPSEFDPLVERYAAETRLDPVLVKSIIKVESDFNPRATSKAGAMGLMQLMKGTAAIYKIKNPYDPDDNIRAGCRHFAALMDEFGNDVILALAAYHAGSSRVRRAGGVPPIKDTILYVKKVLGYYEPRSDTDIERGVTKLYYSISNDTIEIRN